MDLSTDNCVKEQSVLWAVSACTQENDIVLNVGKVYMLRETRRVNMETWMNVIIVMIVF